MEDLKKDLEKISHILKLLTLLVDDLLNKYNTNKITKEEFIKNYFESFQK